MATHSPAPDPRPALRPQVIDTLKFASAATDAINASVCALSSTPNSIPDLIGRIIDRPEPGDEATGGRDDRRGGILKGLIGPLHQRGLILADPANHRTPGLLTLSSGDAASRVW